MKISIEVNHDGSKKFNFIVAEYQYTTRMLTWKIPTHGEHKLSNVNIGDIIIFEWDDNDPNAFPKVAHGKFGGVFNLSKNWFKKDPLKITVISELTEVDKDVDLRLMAKGEVSTSGEQNIDDIFMPTEFMAEMEHPVEDVPAPTTV